MSEAVIASIITGVCSLIAVLVTAKTTQNKIMYELKLAQAVTDTKIEELTREVHEHNNFAKRVPVLEEQVKVINHRIDDVKKGA